MKRSGKKFGKAGIVAVLAALILLAAVTPKQFMDERRKFRDEISNKIETKLDGEGKYFSVIFKDEQAKFNFAVTAEDRGRLKTYMKTYFACADEALLDKMVDEANRGRYIVFKEYSDDGVNLKAIFLSPQAKYWDWLIDINGIEKLFHVYNFSADGRQLNRFSIHPPRSMNRFFHSPDGKRFFIAVANFESAPRGKMLIRNISRRGK